VANVDCRRSWRRSSDISASESGNLTCIMTAKLDDFRSPSLLAEGTLAISLRATDWTRSPQVRSPLQKKKIAACRSRSKPILASGGHSCLTSVK